MEWLHECMNKSLILTNNVIMNKNKSENYKFNLVVIQYCIPHHAILQES